jgi:hypothetical protein
MCKEIRDLRDSTRQPVSCDEKSEGGVDDGQEDTTKWMLE